MDIDRRSLLSGIAFAALLPAAAPAPFEFSLDESEWRRRLDPLSYAVLREAATEQAFTSPLLKEHRVGTFLCKGCALPLFSSSTKYDSRTGWPSFWKPLRDAVRTSKDFELPYPRTEVHCRRCGGHLGHVFDDGPPPTRLRYCMNGAALTFQPSAGK